MAILGPMTGGGNAFITSLAAGMTLAGIVAGAVGYFLLYGGVRGPYLTIVTLALSLVAQRIATGWAKVTGGDAGLLGAPPPGLSIGGWTALLGDPISQYCLVVIILMTALAGIWLWCRGRRGRILAAIQDNEAKLRSLGYDTAGQLLTVFVLSAMLAALAGGLYAAVSGFVAPDLVGCVGHPAGPMDMSATVGDRAAGQQQARPHEIAPADRLADPEHHLSARRAVTDGRDTGAQMACQLVDSRERQHLVRGLQLDFE